MLKSFVKLKSNNVYTKLFSFILFVANDASFANIFFTNFKSKKSFKSIT